MAAMNPGANTVNVLDFANAEDSKLYHRAIKGCDDDMKYDLSPVELQTFLDSVYGMDGILMVATAATPAVENLIEKYGIVTMAKCTASA
jgi:hypothetical protein